MVTSQPVTLHREIVDKNTVISRIKSGNTVVHVKSIFGGGKNISDILFEIAKTQMNALAQHKN